MKLSVELYTEKPLFINDGSFVRLSLRTHGLVFPQTMGVDRFFINSYLLTGKRLSGVGRNMEYNKQFIPGLSSAEARPGAFLDVKEENLDDISLIIETNLILDPGTMKECACIRIINESGKKFDVPLKRPDIEISWDGRGRFVVPITEFVNSKLIRPAQVK